jgi:chymotrypsin
LHPDYDNTLIRNDIAVIRLPTSVAFNAQIQPVTLPTRAQAGEQFDGEAATISGWGRFSDGNCRLFFLNMNIILINSSVFFFVASNDIAAQLRFVNVPVITNLACRIRFPTIIQDSNICSSGEGGRGACQGDSGGPLTVQRGANSVQVGVVSFGLAIGCEVGWPSAFARVTSFLDFIQANTDLTIT